MNKYVNHVSFQSSRMEVFLWLLCEVLIGWSVILWVFRAVLFQSVVLGMNPSKIVATK